MMKTLEFELSKVDAEWLLEVIGSTNSTEQSNFVYTQVESAINKVYPEPEIVRAEDISNWDKCHLCNGLIEGTNITIEGIYAYQPINCTDCGMAGTEIYKAMSRVLDR